MAIGHIKRGGKWSLQPILLNQKQAKKEKKLHEVNQELTSESRKLSGKATAVHMDPFLFARITLALLHNVHIQILAKIRRRSEEVIF